MNAKEKLRAHVRWMIRRDMPEALTIEQTSFDSPWTEEDFLRCLRQRNVIGRVAEVGETIVGFVIYELHKDKLHILNMAVDPQQRRRGVGTALIKKLFGSLSDRRQRLTVEVRESNLAAQMFFRDQGFRALRVIRNFYADTDEAAYFMQRNVRDDITLDFAESEGPVNRISKHQEEWP